MHSIDIEYLKREIPEKLKSLNADKIILFGSFVYGKPTEDSDIDICIIKNDFSNRKEEKRKARELLRSIRIAKDIILIDEEYFYSHSDKNWINTPLYEIREKGLILYEKR